MSVPSKYILLSTDHHSGVLPAGFWSVMRGNGRTSTNTRDNKQLGYRGKGAGVPHSRMERRCMDMWGGS